MHSLVTLAHIVNSQKDSAFSEKVTFTQLLFLFLNLVKCTKSSSEVSIKTNHGTGDM